MDEGQQNNILTINHPHGAGSIVTGLVLILGGLIAVSIAWQSNTLGFLIGLGIALLGIELLLFFSWRYIFDRTKGELTILR
jgi:hypothetical protein